MIVYILSFTIQTHQTVGAYTSLAAAQQAAAASWTLDPQNDWQYYAAAPAFWYRLAVSPDDPDCPIGDVVIEEVAIRGDADA